MPLPIVANSAGTPVPLERALAAGGEGVVYTLRGEPAFVAKVYRRPPDARKVEKLRWMVEQPAERLTAVAAWPTGLLFAPDGATLVGFVMPRLVGFEPIQHLYNPAQRLRYFPRATWAFLVAAARNAAAAFDELHQAGALVGDVNQSNVRVSGQALVRLIDCDSFQVTVNGHPHLCEVGVAHYTPPELQGRSLAGLVRTFNHDRFGLAVVLFQLLFLGRHPYAGVYQGRGDLAFEDAIAQYRFAYGPHAGAVQMAPPPFTPTFDDLPPALLDLAARAFERGSEAERRPSAAEWYAALTTLAGELATCNADAGHQFWQGAAGCPWCRIAARGPDYFLGVGDPSFVFAPDEPRLRELLHRLRQVESLGPSPLELARPRLATMPTPLPPGVDDHFRPVGILLVSCLVGGLLVLAGCFSTTLLVAGLVATVGSAVALYFVVTRSVWYREYLRRRTAWEAAEQEMDAARTGYLAQVDQAQRQRAGLVRKARDALDRCRTLPRDYAAEVAGLSDRLRELAERAYLTQFILADATIPKIGEGRKQTLASYNVLTAADVDPAVLATIKGFGKALIGYLTAWRQQCLAEFTFDANQKVPEADQRAVAMKFRRQQQALFAEAELALDALRAAATAEAGLAAGADAARETLARWHQARIDWELFLATYPAMRRSTK